MASYCDRSTCDDLLDAIGRYVFGTLVKDEWVILVVPNKGRRKVIIIKYCPFCGGRLDNIEMAKGEVIDVRAKKS